MSVILMQHVITLMEIIPVCVMLGSVEMVSVVQVVKVVI